MTLQWIDRGTGVAYVVVDGQMPAFVEFLNAIDRLIADPAWHPGTPVIEDLRDYRGYAPGQAPEQARVTGVGMAAAARLEGGSHC